MDINYNTNKYDENILERYGLQFSIDEYYIIYLMIAQLDFDKDFYDLILENYEIKKIDLNDLLNKLKKYFEINELEFVYITYYEFYTIAIFLELLIDNKLMLNVFYLSLVKQSKIKKSAIKSLYNKIDIVIQRNEPKYKRIRKGFRF